MVTIIGTVVGGVIGAIGLPVLMTLLHLLTAPELTRDPWYPAWWFLIGPFGAILGGVTGAAMGYRTSGHSLRETGLICVVGGMIVAAVLAPILLLGIRSALEENALWEFMAVMLPIFGPGFLWACLLVKKGREAMAWGQQIP